MKASRPPSASPPGLPNVTRFPFFFPPALGLGFFSDDIPGSRGSAGGAPLAPTECPQSVQPPCWPTVLSQIHVLYDLWIYGSNVRSRELYLHLAEEAPNHKPA